MRIGITGHQNFSTSREEKWVTSALKEWLGSVPCSIGYTSLAAGTDQIFARILLEMHVPLVAILPSAGYEDAFESEEDEREFRRILGLAKEVRQLAFCAPSEAAFMEAGRCIVQASDLIVAVWNGKPAAGFGGTADVIEYAVRLKRPVYHFNPLFESAMPLIQPFPR